MEEAGWGRGLVDWSFDFATVKRSHDITLLLAHQAVTSRLNMLRENKHARTTGLLAKTLPKNLLIFFLLLLRVQLQCATMEFWLEEDNNYNFP